MKIYGRQTKIWKWSTALEAGDLRKENKGIYMLVQMQSSAARILWYIEFG